MCLVHAQVLQIVGQRWRVFRAAAGACNCRTLAGKLATATCRWIGQNIWCLSFGCGGCKWTAVACGGQMMHYRQGQVPHESRRCGY